MKTKDFSGEYDYERGEAQSEANSFLEYASEQTPEQNRKYADKILAHWQKCLCEKGLQDFRDEWNKLVPEFKI